MTRDEALKILNIEEDVEEGLDHKQVLERFETIYEKNKIDKGGSFYLQSKAYFAKEHLMKDFEPELN